SEPHRLGRIAIDGKRVIARLAQGRRLAGNGEWPHLAVAEPEHQRFRGGYNQALVVLIDGGYVELEPSVARVGGEPAVLVADQSVAIHPQAAVPAFKEGARIEARQPIFVRNRRDRPLEKARQSAAAADNVHAAIASLDDVLDLVRWQLLADRVGGGFGVPKE